MLFRAKFNMVSNVNVFIFRKWLVGIIDTNARGRGDPQWVYVNYENEVSKGAKIRNRYNQVPHLTQDTKGK